jgi:hypothetical protein
MSTLQAELLQRGVGRVVDVTATRFQPNSGALAAVGRAPPSMAPLIMQGSGVDGKPAELVVMVLPSQQPANLQAFDQECVNDAALASLGSEAARASSGRLAARQQALMLLGWLPADCIVTIPVLRPGVMGWITNEFPAALNAILRQRQ